MPALAAAVSVESASGLAIPIVLLLAPIALTLWFRRTTFRSSETNRPAVWMASFRLNRFVMAAIVACWWALFDLVSRSDFLHLREAFWLDGLQPFYPGTLVFWVPPIVALGIFLLLCYSTNAAVLKLRWRFSDFLKQAWWKLASFVFPLLLVVTGFEIILKGNVRGIIWLIVAGVLAHVGSILFQRSEGIRLHSAKSGALRNRSFAIAKNMGVLLRRVYLVSAGKGHLTTAYGGSHVIGITDSLGRYLTGPEMDVVIAHELSHVKQRHGMKQYLLTVATFALMTLLIFRLPPLALPVKLSFDILIIFAPLMGRCFLSRRFEYAADRGAVDFIGDPEIAIRALTNIYRVNAVPADCNKFTELFSTHPSLTHRTQAIAQVGKSAARSRQ